MRSTVLVPIYPDLVRQLVMALIGELVADPVALEQLRRALDAESSDHATAAPPAYTASTLAAALGVSAKTVRNAIARGELRAIKRGARWIVSEDAVREWAAGRGAVSVHRKGAKWVVRYRDGQRQRSRSFDRKGDAERFDVEVVRRRQLGALPSLDAGRETLDQFVTEVWAPTHGVTLAPKTRKTYAALYDHHIAPSLGPLPLRDIRPETIARWQADRLAAGGGAIPVRQA